MRRSRASFGSLFLQIAAAITALASASENENHVSSKYKAPNENTPQAIANQWQQQDADLWSYVESKIPAVLDHTGSSAFDEHLKGVQAVLRYWDAPQFLTNAGLFHSIYGTEAFQGFSLPLSERAAIRDLIGEESERLCWIFCMVDRFEVDETVFGWDPSDVGDNNTKDYTFRARPELGRFDIKLKDKEEWLNFIELSLADWLEQVEGAAEEPLERFHWKKGEAYSFKKTSFRKMAEVLTAERSDRLGEGTTADVKAMLAEVMSTEPKEVRSRVQLRTTPMSEAARAAVEALRSAGENIPENDFFPQPLLKNNESQPSLKTDESNDRIKVIDEL